MIRYLNLYDVISSYKKIICLSVYEKVSFEGKTRPPTLNTINPTFKLFEERSEKFHVGQFFAAFYNNDP